MVTSNPDRSTEQTTRISTRLDSEHATGRRDIELAAISPAPVATSIPSVQAMASVPATASVPACSTDDELLFRLTGRVGELPRRFGLWSRM
jgi:hypothetical protein